MAFRIPNQLPPRASQQQSQQAYPYALRTSSPVQSPVSSAHSPLHIPEDDTREWVLFSPTQENSTTTFGDPRTHTTSTERTPRISDFGSLGFGPRSSADGQEYVDLLDEENNTELDSLDDGLHAFREPSLDAAREQEQPQLHHSEPALLPAHDGLGTFHTSNVNVQEQLWQHERFNPGRRPSLGHRRFSSLQRHFDQTEEPQIPDLEYDRWQRIERWRMEQSRALLEELEKENKRRTRDTRNRGLRERPGMVPRLSTNEVMGDVSVEATNASKEEDTSAGSGELTASQTNTETEESFWRRITRKVIRDLMGLDDSLLSVILGESLVPIAEESGKDDQTSTEGHAKKRKASTILEPELPEEMDEMLKSITSSRLDDACWQDKFLDRIARELGDLVHKLYENPGNFSAYARAPPLPQEHAGAPIARSSVRTSSTSRHNIHPRTPSFNGSRNSASVHTPSFIPTLQGPTTNARHAESWETEEQRHPTISAFHVGESQSETPRHERDRDYWEHELDVGVVFHYLWKRLAGKLPHSNGTGETNQRAYDPSKRAAMIRRNHPLVARAHELARSQRPLHLRTQSASTSAQGLGSTASPILYRHMRRSSSSCASQSTRISVSTKKTIASGSSRHYWDIGGSVGSGSAILAVGGAGGMGGWGDV